MAEERMVADPRRLGRREVGRVEAHRLEAQALGAAVLDAHEHRLDAVAVDRDTEDPPRLGRRRHGDGDTGGDVFLLLRPGAERAEPGSGS
jgi:hypothetical protein